MVVGQCGYGNVLYVLCRAYLNIFKKLSEQDPLPCVWNWSRGVTRIPTGTLFGRWRERLLPAALHVAAGACHFNDEHLTLCTCSQKTSQINHSSPPFPVILVGSSASFFYE